MAFYELNPPFPGEFVATDFSKLVREDAKICWNFTLNEFLQCIPKKSEGKIKCLRSPKFPEDPKADFKWILKLYPFGNKKTKKMKFSSIYLFPVYKKIKSPISVVALISLENKFFLRYCPMQFKYTNNGGYGYHKLIETKQLQSCLSDGSVNIRVMVSSMYEANICHTSNFASERFLQNDYFKLLEDGNYSDVTFFTEDNTEFKVHMNILAARSKGLVDVLSNKMAENSTGNIVVEDCLGSTMKNLLSFIYSCKIEFVDVSETINLLKASEKYELMDLKLQCSDYLCSVINDKNACSILLTAEDYNLPDLKQKTLEYIEKHKRKFSSINSYDLVLEKKPRLLAEICAKFVKDDNCE